MMPYQLTIPAMIRRAESMHADKMIVSRRADGSVGRATYAEVLQRSRRLIGVLRELGVGRGDRVATFCSNHQVHLEAYYAVPGMGAVLHTLNARLASDELAYIASHGGDSVAIVDRALLSKFEEIRPRTQIRHTIVVDADYETLIANATEIDFAFDIAEDSAAGMCYTSGTTGRPKGVVYSHRSTTLHALTSGLWDFEYVREREVILSLVPMYHANGWGLPYACLLHGAAQVLSGTHTSPHDILSLVESERVTLLTGVPTMAAGVLRALDEQPGRYELSSLRVISLGGAAVSETLIRGFERQGIRVTQGWGMTELSPIGSKAAVISALDGVDDDTRMRYRTSQGRPFPFVEMRLRGDNGIAPHDGAAMGELEVRGPWVASAYYEAPETADRFTEDGWFRTGDIASIDERGYVFIRDRAKDVIKSGGEWISSVALEHAIAHHPAVLEAAVIGLPHPVWDERPLAIAVLRAGVLCGSEEIISHLEPHFPRFWLPEAVEFVNVIPRTSVGKYDKRAMRKQFAGYFTKDSWTEEITDASLKRSAGADG